MSDYSRNASIESPASLSLDLPLPVPPPQVSIDVDQDLEYHVSTPSPSPSPTLAESVLPEGRISPQSALAILQAFGTRGNADNLREVARITARTLFQRTQAYEATIGRLQGDIAVLRARTAATPVTPRVAPRPNGFLPNNGHLPHFYIPHLGHRALARFVWKCPADPTMAEGTMGGTGAETYAYPLEALPLHDASGDGGENRSGEPLPEWLLDLLRGSETTFWLVLHASQSTGDWGLPADIARYRATVNRVNELHAAREGILDSLNSCWESLDLIAGRLGGAKAPSRLAHLQYVADIVPAESQDRSNQQGRRGRGRVARGRAPV
ncbi:hypothetical protein F5888DRAFT_1639005 [Russula emetica]|nr:hypothetical protein F5888DRAFT_1639005 [Russula emetica]